MRSLAVLIAALALGCAAHKPPRAAAAGQQQATVAGTWERFELPLEGLSASFPAKPDQFVTLKDSDGGTMTSSNLVAAHADEVFGLSFTARGGKDRAPDADWLNHIKKAFKKADRFDEFELGDFRGMVVWETEAGKRRAMWYLLIGDGFVSAVVSAPLAKFDEARARQFFASVRFELPWRLYAAPVGRLSIAVPATAIEVSAAALDYAADGPSRAFYVGGKSELAFVIGSIELDAETDAKGDEEILGGTLEGIIAHGTNVVWREPMLFDQAHGLDYLGEFKDVYLRGRLLRVGHYLYALQIRGSSRAAVSGESAQRFLESLRWY